MLLYLFLYCPVQCQVLVSAVSSRCLLLAVIKVRGSESPSQTIAQSTSVVFSVAYAVFYGVKFLALPPTLKPGGPGSLFVWPLPMGGGGEGGGGTPGICGAIDFSEESLVKIVTMGPKIWSNQIKYPPPSNAWFSNKASWYYQQSMYNTHKVRCSINLYWKWVVRSHLYTKDCVLTHSQTPQSISTTPHFFKKLLFSIFGNLVKYGLLCLIKYLKTLKPVTFIYEFKKLKLMFWWVICTTVL